MLDSTCPDCGGRLDENDECPGWYGEPPLPAPRKEATVENKLTLCVDFDGVIHLYVTPWTNALVISDPPVAGAFEWLESMLVDFEVCIYSSRSKEPDGIEAMKNWMYKCGCPPHVVSQLKWPTQKPAAFMTIDDRCWCFQGPDKYPTAHDLRTFKPWNRK